MPYIAKLFDSRVNKIGLLNLWEERGMAAPSHRYEAMYEFDGFDHITTWLLFHDKHTLPVGCLSLLPRRFEIFGKDVLCGVNCDIIVTKRHRTLGPAVILLESLMKECKDLGFKVLLAMPNEMSRPIFIRAGYKPLGAVCRWSKVLRSKNKLKIKIKNIFARKIIFGFADFFLKFTVDSGAYWRWRSIRKEVKIKDTPFSSQQELFCHDGDGEHAQAYLLWRFGRLNCKGSKVLSLYHDDVLLGYVIYYAEQKEAVIEYISSAVKDNMNIVLIAFAEKMRQGGIEVVSTDYYSAGRLRKNFQQAGFLYRSQREVFTYSVDKNLENAISNITDWSLFECDLDL